MRSLPDNNLSYPILIETNNGSGSGFYYRNDEKLFIVTARHVLFEKDEDSKYVLRDSKILVTSYDQDLDIKEPLELEMDLTKLNIRKDDKNDIVLVEFADMSVDDKKNKIMKVLDGAKQLSTKVANIVVVPPSSLKKYNDVTVSNDVYILGYPSSLSDQKMCQIEPKRPLLRKGIVAGKNDTNGTIILDCPVYFGNSGGLAIEVERIKDHITYKVIGVVSQYIPFVERLISSIGYTNLSYENSGYSVVVPVDTIEKLSIQKPQIIQ